LSQIIEIRDLKKSFGDFTAVNNLSLHVAKGEILGLLGPNGAGKTTTMKMMYCSLIPDEGEIFILGLNHKKNFRQIKSRIGVVPQEDGLDQDFTVRENLIVQGQYFLMDKIVAQRKADDLLRLVRLEKKANSAVQSLSGGMKRRLAIARGLMNSPEVLFFDEPTTGLDPHARIWIWDFLNQLKANMGTVVLTTHYMDEAERLCDRVAIMDEGKILEIGSPKEMIKSQVGTDVLEIDVDTKDLGYWSGRLKEKNISYLVLGKTIFIHLISKEQIQEVMSLVVGERFLLRKASLNDVFLKLTGREIISKDNDERSGA
jgi:lipooligosaccharide transport system ATP-binding protein